MLLGFDLRRANVVALGKGIGYNEREVGSALDLVDLAGRDDLMVLPLESEIDVVELCAEPQEHGDEGQDFPKPRLKIPETWKRNVAKEKSESGL